MIANAFTTSLVAVYESSIWDPIFWRLIFEFLAVGIVLLDTSRNFLVDSHLYWSGDFAHLWRKLADVLLSVIMLLMRNVSGHGAVSNTYGQKASIVKIFCLLFCPFFQAFDIEAC